ncbi:MAG: PPC domain-containing DNA-binding protein [Methanotrichaceae archaeon]
MQYSECSLGRIFVIRIDDNEDLIKSIQSFVVEKNVLSGMIIFLGALREGRLVTGPQFPVIPPTPHFENFEGAWETLGIATVYPSEDGPKIHIHASIGRGEQALTGCLREKAATYIIIEAVLFEFSGLKARRDRDDMTGLNLLSLDKRLP